MMYVDMLRSRRSMLLKRVARVAAAARESGTVEEVHAYLSELADEIVELSGKIVVQEHLAGVS